MCYETKCTYKPAGSFFCSGCQARWARGAHRCKKTSRPLLLRGTSTRGTSRLRCVKRLEVFIFFVAAFGIVKICCLQMLIKLIVLCKNIALLQNIFCNNSSWRHVVYWHCICYHCKNYPKSGILPDFGQNATLLLIC